MAAASLAEQISARSRATRETARREWQALARAAVSGDVPDLVTIEDLARALGIDRQDAADAFEGDVSALREHPAHLATADRIAAQARDLLAPFGDDAGLAAAVAEATERADQLRRVEVRLHYSRVASGEESTRARYLAARHPRVFSAEATR
jgi:hypothetical protein